MTDKIDLHLTCSAIRGWNRNVSQGENQVVFALFFKKSVLFQAKCSALKTVIYPIPAKMDFNSLVVVPKHPNQDLKWYEMFWKKVFLRFFSSFRPTWANINCPGCHISSSRSKNIYSACVRRNRFAKSKSLRTINHSALFSLGTPIARKKTFMRCKQQCARPLECVYTVWDTRRGKKLWFY